MTPPTTGTGTPSGVDVDDGGDATTATTTAASASSAPATDVVIGLDVGTQSTKAVLYDPTTHAILSRASKSYGLLPSTDPSTGGSIPGRAEQDPSLWIDAVRHCLSSLSSSLMSGVGGGDGVGGGSQSRLKLVGMGVSGQQHGMVCLDSEFDVVRPAKLWCDVEAARQARALSKELSRLRGGHPVNVPPGFTAPKVRWLKEREPENFARTRYCLLPHEYVNLVLCGGDDERHIAAEAGDASGTGVFDPKTRTFDVEAAARCVDERYPSMLPQPMLGPLDTVGELCPEWRGVCGLRDDHPGVAISAGSGDNMCSALGCGVVSSSGDAVLSLGTSGTIFGVSDTPVETTKKSTGEPSAVAPFCDASGKHLPLVCVMSCTGVLSDVLTNLCRRPPSSAPTSAAGEDGPTVTHEEAEELASRVPPGCHGLAFHPYLGGERTPDWPEATGSLVGITSLNIAHLGGEDSVGVWYRAALEGISYNLRMALEEIRESCGGGGSEGFDPRGLLVVGGGSRNGLWRQILSDVLGMELRFPLEAESAALGAALQAGAAAAAAAVAAKKRSGDGPGATVLSLEEYVRGQPIPLEVDDDGGGVVVVRPTDDDGVREAYRVGYERFRASANLLFGGDGGGGQSRSRIDGEGGGGGGGGGGGNNKRQKC